ncbi:MAG: response regulator transcription factor [Lawsonibacter sp.]|nr:response regulator transcription factor [Lawsonibacter sp.]
MSSLRKKLGLNARDNRYIQTFHGAGYRFTNPE